jgi:hypothetical protein
MKYNFRNIRIFPLLLLFLLVMLFLMNIVGRRTGFELPVVPERSRPPAMLRFFTSFAAYLCTRNSEGESEPSKARFELPPNRREQIVHCCVQYEMKDKTPQSITCAWYRENKLQFSEDIYLSGPRDTVTSTLAISRYKTGTWSIDISTGDGVLLSTLVFNMALKAHQGRFRSLDKG